jgi:hypothetical protein
VKGVLFEFASAFGQSVPNAVAFQFNPETLRRTWTQPVPAGIGANPLGAQGDPDESYALTLILDITDVLAADEDSPAGADARAGGLRSRIAALEMLMFPVASAGPPAAGSRRSTPSAQVPAVLFVWGPGRILPVRITSLAITETLFDALLNPTHATVELGFSVITRKALAKVTGQFRAIAIAAYEASLRERETLALFNLSTTAGSLQLPPIPGA